MTALLAIGATIAVNGTLFLAGGGLVHAWYYRGDPADGRWRLQPDKPVPSRDLLVARLPLVGLNVVLFNTLVGLCLWALFTGRTRAVWDPAELGVLGWVAGTAACFLWFHGVTYYVHRLLHTRWLFRHVHKVHHKAHTPVWLDAHYMHPAESFYAAGTLCAPLFLWPVHGWTFLAYVVIVGIHELTDHTGIRFRMWPLAPSVGHDAHHRKVRTNYSQLLDWLDRLHGTTERT